MPRKPAKESTGKFVTRKADDKRPATTVVERVVKGKDGTLSGHSEIVKRSSVTGEYKSEKARAVTTRDAKSGKYVDRGYPSEPIAKPLITKPKPRK